MPLIPALRGKGRQMSVSLRLAGSIYKVPGQSGLHLRPSRKQKMCFVVFWDNICKSLHDVVGSVETAIVGVEGQVREWQTRQGDKRMNR